MPRKRFGCRAFLAALLFLAPPAATRAVDLDYARESDPLLAFASDKGKILAPDFAPLRQLWLAALGRPEADLKRQAADAIARGQARGVPGLAETAPRLLEELEAADAHRLVRLAAARALAALDARQAAAAFKKHAEADGPDMAAVAEPALARWKYAPMRPVWLARLESPGTPLRALLLAIEAAATAELPEAIPHLRRLALTPGGPVDVRVAAARSLGTLHPRDLEETARALAADRAAGTIPDRLVAVMLLAHHKSPAAVALLRRLALDPEPAVAAVAVRRLLDIDLPGLAPVLADLARHPDVGLRQLAAQGLVRLHTPEAVARLGPLLDDPHRGLRESVRDTLIGFAAEPALADTVRRAVMAVLDNGGPRGREQAALLAGVIRYQPAAGRLVELLQDDHGQVAVPAAWALRRVAVPATCDRIFEHVTASLDRARPGRAQGPASKAVLKFASAQMPHLIEALGLMRYRAAVPLLREFLPVPPVMPSGNPFHSPRLRAAALWALGHIHAGEPVPDLVALFSERVAGTGPSRQELPGPRTILAVNLGRMKARDAVGTLRQVYGDEKADVYLRRACAWALEQITGTAVAPVLIKPAVVRGSTGSWFLQPEDPQGFR